MRVPTGVPTVPTRTVWKPRREEISSCVQRRLTQLLASLLSSHWRYVLTQHEESNFILVCFHILIYSLLTQCFFKKQKPKDGDLVAYTSLIPAQGRGADRQRGRGKTQQTKHKKKHWANGTGLTQHAGGKKGAGGKEGGRRNPKH